MNLIAGTEGLTFEQALAVYADKVVEERKAQEKAASSKSSK